MTRRGRLAILLLVASTMSTGCSTHTHRVGAGPNGVGSESQRQYYLFFGLIRLNEADSQRLTHDAVSYEIVTEWSFVDILITTLLLPLTVTTRTVTVNR
jgi:hypothetical protein